MIQFLFIGSHDKYEAKLPICVLWAEVLPTPVVAQVSAADLAQGVRGVAQTQLLPRGHGPHLAGLLRELHLLGAELHQPVERHEGPGEHAARLARHVCGQVSVKSMFNEYSPSSSQPPKGLLTGHRL